MVFGFLLGLLLAIAYNTSSQTAVLEGGRGHLRFGFVLEFAAGAAVVCFVLGAIFDNARARGGPS